MPRTRSSAIAVTAVDLHSHLESVDGVAAAVQSWALDADDEGCSGAQAAADAFAAGRAYRAYGHDARIFDLSFHPGTAELLVSASDDCSAGVWRRRKDGPAGAGAGRYMQVASFCGHTDSVMRAAWSPDGRMVASGSSDGVVCLWHPTEEALEARGSLGAQGTRQLGALKGHPEEVYACIFLQQQGQQQEQQGQQPGSCSATPQRLVAASGESLFLWDLPTQQLVQQAPPAPAPAAAAAVPERWRPGYLFGVAAQPEGPLLGAACSDGALRLWARQGGDASLAPLATLPWNAAMGADCCFAPGGLFCAVAKDGAALVLDVRRGTCLHHLQLHAPLLSCTVLPHGGRQALVAAGADGAVHFVDLVSGDVASLRPEAAPERPLLCAALSADGSCLAASGEAVALGADDWLGGGPAAATGRPGGGSMHAPPAKWSPIHLWQRAAQPAS